ncbi:MAG: tRNA pseudouridine(55) synthase TruB [Opitutales bacterium]|nr:tRNA pseudouridine(55) synthase TruB [Opitutales bacterium]
MQQPSDHEYNGVLLIDKPSGITSHDVVDRVRKCLKMRKVGHAGTLDPNATGLMLILVGKGTKISQFLMSKDKTYTGVIQLGLETDSYDIDGEVLVQNHPAPIDSGVIEKAMAKFIGDQYQKPPMFSAKKIKGVPLYKHARKGKEVEREERLIRIHSFSLTQNDFPDLHFEISVSKGTYIRSVAHDLGQALGTGACLTVLRRTKISDFSIEKAIKLDDLPSMASNMIKSRLIPIYQAVPSHVLS